MQDERWANIIVKCLILFFHTSGDKLQHEHFHSLPADLNVEEFIFCVFSYNTSVIGDVSQDFGEELCSRRGEERRGEERRGEERRGEERRGEGPTYTASSVFIAAAWIHVGNTVLYFVQ